MGVDVETARLNETRRLLWVWITTFTAIILLSVTYGPTASTYKYTFVEPPTAPGTLITERWSYDFIFTASMCMMILAPLTMAYMSDASQMEARRNLHVIIVVLLMIYFTAVCVTWSFNAARANQATTANARNPANDPRWCCVNYGLPASECYNAPCAGVGQGDLVINAVFLFKYVFVWLYVALLAVDLLITLCVFRPRVYEYVETRSGVKKPLLPQPSRPSEYDEPPRQEDNQEPDASVPSNKSIQGQLKMPAQYHQAGLKAPGRGMKK
jgi:hypothetical protein